MQSVSALQLVLQAVAPHTYGLQAAVADEGQSPVPLHDAEAVCVPAVQLAARHEVPDPGYAHALVVTPSQAPPHELPSVVQAVREPCGAPVTAVQVPALPTTSQAWHWPVQVLLQQTPSAQIALTHSELPPHSVPFDLRKVATTA
jgi:hypothetical protein